MKRVMVTMLLAGSLAIAVSAQMPKYGATVWVEKHVDVTKFRTYTWTEGYPTTNKAAHGQIVDAVDRELSALGMTKDPVGDVLVSYYQLSRTDVDVKGPREPNGLKREYPAGTLIVTFLDPESRQPWLKLRGDRPLNLESAALEAGIRSMVHEMFARYPGRRSK